MVTTIYALTNDGKITERAVYSISAKQALIAYIMQYIRKNWNTWQYPQEINGIFESPTKKGVFHFEDINNDRILTSITK
jgi:hypothetical protein